MKKILSLAFLAIFSGDMYGVIVKNAVGVGAATNDGKIRVTNIGTYGTSFTYGTVTHAGKLVTLGPVTLKVCDTTLGDDESCRGVMIEPGQQGSVNSGSTVVVWAYYPNQMIMVKYAAPIGNGYLEFPIDFKDNPLDAKAFTAIPR